MKHLKLLSTAIFISIALTACGGGATTSTSNGEAENTTAAPTETNSPSSTPASPEAPSTTPGNDEETSGEIIIDNGRGTTNNQDTETAED